MGIKKTHLYLKGSSRTCLIGATWMDTVGSSQPGWIDEELFELAIPTFRLAR